MWFLIQNDKELDMSDFELAGSNCIQKILILHPLSAIQGYDKWAGSNLTGKEMGTWNPHFLNIIFSFPLHTENQIYRA